MSRNYLQSHLVFRFYVKKGNMSDFINFLLSLLVVDG